MTDALREQDAKQTLPPVYEARDHRVIICDEGVASIRPVAFCYDWQIAYRAALALNLTRALGMAELTMAANDPKLDLRAILLAPPRPHRHR